MRDVLELLLKDVDPDIRDVMLKDATLEPDSFGGMTIQLDTPMTRQPKNWEVLPDPFFLIINWQKMRHENRHKQAGAQPQG